jgi:osmotically inducible protein OsmC
MPIGRARARWTGTPPQGDGEVRLASGAYDGPFGPPGPGPVHSDPEEMLAGALASCFAMALYARLARGGVEVARVETGASVELAKTRDGPRIVAASVDVEVHGAIDDGTLRRAAEQAFGACPVAVALAAVPARLGAVRRVG